MSCPLKLHSKRKCALVACPYYSVANKSKCFHGEPISISNLAYHKGTTAKSVKLYLENTNETIEHCLKLFKYAEFCSEIKPTAYDYDLYNQLQQVKPYNTPLFSFVTLPKFARMNRHDAFEAFKTTGVEIADTLYDFLTKPLNMRKVL